MYLRGQGWTYYVLDVWALQHRMSLKWYVIHDSMPKGETEWSNKNLHVIAYEKHMIGGNIKFMWNSVRQN